MATGRIDRRTRAAELIVSTALTLLFAWSVEGRGIPALRHDWIWPEDRARFLQRVFELSLGWTPEGLGHATPYPMTYFVMLPFAAIEAAVGSAAALAIMLVLIGASAFVVGELVASRYEAPAFAGPVLGATLLFSPWTYNKIVAGHLTQSIAAFGLTLVLCEIANRESRGAVVRLGMVAAALQIQFFLIALAFAAVRASRVEIRRAIALGLVLFLPTIAGVVLGWRSLLGWLLIVQWEEYQSVPLAQGWWFGGYFTHYADAAFAAAGPWIRVVLILVAVAAVALRPRSEAPVFAAIAAVVTIVSSGVVGPIAGAWRYLLLVLPQIGVFREMYDLIGVAAAAELALLGIAVARLPQLRFVIGAVAAVSIVAWVASPPMQFFVPASQLPKPSASIERSARYLIVPALQPLAFDGAGSGAAPWFVGTSAGNRSLDSLESNFAVQGAEGRYERTGDASSLRSLGVDAIACAPGIADVVREPIAACASGEPSVREPSPRAAPIFALESEPKVCSLCTHTGEGARFFADRPDAGSSPSAEFISAPKQVTFAQPQDGWVDARIVFDRRPDLAEGLGGAYTEQNREALEISRAPQALVSVEGSLAEVDGPTIARDTRGFAWVDLPQSGPVPMRLRCDGKCLLVGTGRPAGIPLEARPGAAVALSGDAVLPFVQAVRIEAGRHGTLRYLESYDAAWTAFSTPDFRVLPHERLDAAINGWDVSEDGRPRTIYLVETTAAAQGIASVVGEFVFFAYAFFELRRLPARRKMFRA